MSTTDGTDGGVELLKAVGDQMIISWIPDAQQGDAEFAFSAGFGFGLAFPCSSPIPFFCNGNVYSVTLYVGHLQLVLLILHKSTVKRLPESWRRSCPYTFEHF